MDRFNRNHPSYDHYSQIYQEGDQHTSQPETGQTSGGVPTSGAWGSYPAPDQSYSDLNTLAQIPSWPRPDWEYLPPPQPTPLENIPQNDALPGPSNLRQPFNRINQRSQTEVKTQFLAGLNKYAEGYTLKDCSADINFSRYVTIDGHLKKPGIALYSKLGRAEKHQVDQALEARILFHSLNSTPIEAFLEGLEAYASGAELQDCSASIPYHAYVSSQGYLHDPGKLLFGKLEEQDKDRVIDAINARRELYSEHGTAIDRFLDGLEAYASGATLKNCSATIKFSDYVTTDGILRNEGKVLLRGLAGSESMDRVNNALATRRRMAAQRISKDLPNFLKALEPYSIGLELKECGEKSGLKSKAKTYLTPEGGLTAKGELLKENLPLEEQLEVLNKVGKRRQLIDPSAQEPESPWPQSEMPSSIQEMGGINQAEMYNPMQTDAMYNPMQVDAMYNPMQADAMYNPMQADAMYNPMQADAMYNPMQTDAMYNPMQTDAMYNPMQADTMYNPMQADAMYNPMQTEDMWAAAWQLTGQAMPGTWGGPSESAESSIPHYSSDVVGTDFQHRYDSNGLMPQRAPDRLIGRGIVHNMLINIQGEEYRVHDTGQRSMNPTHENPLGSIVMLVPRMRGG
jgi:hypothetical protein